VGGTRCQGQVVFLSGRNNMSRGSRPARCKPSVESRRTHPLLLGAANLLNKHGRRHDIVDDGDGSCKLMR